jgi:hypothetical protein
MFSRTKLHTDKFSGAIVRSVAKLAGINLRKFGSFSYWFDKLGFTTKGRHDAVLIITFSWGFQLGGYIYIYIYNFYINTAPPTSFLAPLPGRKKISARGVSHFQSFTLLLFYFFFASFYQKYKKISPFIVVIFTYLLLVLLEWVLLRTPSCVILLAPKTMILSTLPLRHLLLKQFFMIFNLLC